MRRNQSVAAVIMGLFGLACISWWMMTLYTHALDSTTLPYATDPDAIEVIMLNPGDELRYQINNPFDGLTVLQLSTKQPDESSESGRLEISAVVGGTKLLIPSLSADQRRGQPLVDVLLPRALDQDEEIIIDMQAIDGSVAIPLESSTALLPNFYHSTAWLNGENTFLRPLVRPLYENRAEIRYGSRISMKHEFIVHTYTVLEGKPSWLQWIIGLSWVGSCVVLLMLVYQFSMVFLRMSKPAERAALLIGLISAMITLILIGA